MNDSNNTQYALHADPGKPLRDAQAEIERLNKQVIWMRNDYTAQIEQIITERNVYRSLVLKVMNLKD